MALLFCDGMDAYTVLADMTRKGWQGAGGSSFLNSTYFSLSATAGAYGGGALLIAPNDGALAMARWNTFNYTPGCTLNVAALMKQTGFPSVTLGTTTDNGGLIILGYDGNVPGGFDTKTILSVATNGALVAYAYGGTTPLGTGTTNFCDGNYHWVEVQIVFATTATGSITVTVDGVREIHVINAVTLTGSAPDGSVGLGCGANNGGASCANWFDDFIVWDNTGTAFNTYPIGQQRISTLNPSAAGNSAQFTASAGANYAVAAQPYAGAATLTSTVTGQTDLYETTGLGAFNPSTINAVVCNVYASNPGGGGSFTAVPKVESKGTTESAGALALTTTAQTVQGVFYTDSAGAAWTPTSVNAAQIGVGD